MTSVGIAIIAKTPEPGKSKTRLSPPLKPDQCAEISACFIEDLADNIQALADAGDGRIAGYALYTPEGSEQKLGRLLPDQFGYILQTSGDLGARLAQGVRDILAKGHAGAIIVSSDSPTLPAAYFRYAVDRLLNEDCIVLCPAVDGGYTFIGVRQAHARLFEDMPWSTEVVYDMTVARALEIGVTVVSTPMWYDVDDAATLRVLADDLSGAPMPFDCSEPRMKAPMTEAFLATLDHLDLPGKSSSAEAQSLGAVAS
jgi:rSAM/selenodomain-associated transferase 1